MTLVNLIGKIFDVNRKFSNKKAKVCLLNNTILELKSIERVVGVKPLIKYLKMGGSIHIRFYLGNISKH